MTKLHCHVYDFRVYICHIESASIFSSLFLFHYWVVVYITSPSTHTSLGAVQKDGVAIPSRHPVEVVTVKLYKKYDLTSHVLMDLYFNVRPFLINSFKTAAPFNVVSHLRNTMLLASYLERIAQILKIRQTV